MSTPEKNSTAPTAERRPTAALLQHELHRAAQAFQLFSPECSALTSRDWDETKKLNFTSERSIYKSFISKLGLAKEQGSALGLLARARNWRYRCFQNKGVRGRIGFQRELMPGKKKKQTTNQPKKISMPLQTAGFTLSLFFLMTTIAYNFWTWLRVRSLLWEEQEEKKTCSFNDWKVQDELLYGIKKVKYYIAKISHDLTYQV